MPQTIKVDLRCSLPENDLIKLCRVVEQNHAERSSHVVQFVSAYGGEGANRIAFESAVAAAVKMGKRVLFIDTGTRRAPAAEMMAKALSAPLSALLKPGVATDGVIVAAAGTSFSYTMLSGEPKNLAALGNLDALFALFINLRQHYDFIILNSEAVLTDVAAAALVKVVDGSILVIEAERTRVPVAKEVLRVIEANGGQVIGAVLNKRRLYIPRLLYRFFYK